MLPGGTLNHFAYDLGIEDVATWPRALRRARPYGWTSAASPARRTTARATSSTPSAWASIRSWCGSGSAGRRRIGGWPAGVLAALRVCARTSTRWQAELQGRARPLWLLFVGQRPLPAGGPRRPAGATTWRTGCWTSGSCTAAAARPLRLLAAAVAGPLTRSPAHAAVRYGGCRVTDRARHPPRVRRRSHRSPEGSVTLEKLPEALTVYRPMPVY